MNYNSIIVFRSTGIDRIFRLGYYHCVNKIVIKIEIRRDRAHEAGLIYSPKWLQQVFRAIPSN